MVTTSTSDRTFDLRGLKDDQKPTTFHGIEIGNGSTYLEIDTGDIYIYDEENKVWEKFA